MVKRLLILFRAALLPFLVVATAQSDAWRTYRDTAAGFAFDYPAGAHLSVEQEASQGHASAFVVLPDEGAGYQGYAVTVFANPGDLPLSRFLSERRDFSSSGGQNVQINGVPALRVAPNIALAGDEAETYWLQGDTIVVRLGLYAGNDPALGPSGAAREAFDRAVSSFRLIPRAAAVPITPGPVLTPLPVRPALANEFISPYGVISTTSAFTEQWDIITNDTRYGVRNLSLTGRKCWGVAWDRMLHSGIDLYRLDGQDAANTQLVAVADGTVAYYNPAYASYPGRVVILSHTLGDGRVLYSMYAHLGSVFVTQGQIIARGQPVGTVLYQPGDSHLHFEMRWFLDGSQIYPSSTRCNGIVYGRGYTYLVHPDDFPAPGHGYVDPDAFIQAHGGPSLTPIGLPDPRDPVLSAQAAGADLNTDAEQPAAMSAPINALVLPEVPAPAPRVISTGTSPYTAYLPLIVRDYPRQQPACVEGQDLLSNGGFEDGPGSAPWVQIKNGASDLIGTTQHYSGTYSVWLGGRNTADEEVLQSFIVPYYTEAVTLTFQRLLISAQGSDRFEVVLENAVGNELSPQIVFNAASPNQAMWANETVVLSGLAAWGNRPMRLSLKGMTYNTSSSFFVDEVTLQTHCAP